MNGTMRPGGGSGIADQTTDGAVRTRRGRAAGLRRLGPVAAGLLAVTLVTGACGSDAKGPAVANTGGGASSPAAAPGQNRADALAYSKCMREHGVSNFPDPNANGQIWLGSTGGPAAGLDPSSPQFQSAQNACKDLAPGGSPEDQKKARTVALKYAQCMRENGVSKFPDPDANGGIKTDQNEVNSNSPQFKAAEKACEKFQPGGAGGPRQSFPIGGGGS